MVRVPELLAPRNTVRSYLREREARHYGPRRPRPTKVDPYKAYLLERIEAARPRWIPAVVLLREVRERGYESTAPGASGLLTAHHELMRSISRAAHRVIESSSRTTLANRAGGQRIRRRE